ncbi:hypothetical protein DCAR_0414546 [Daucus carota subsp. sativus]|uniref:Uncharacterized protein n=1 Tax=Daucus carota subsp. sativus TaxID=79200 RepID=A0AAF0WVH9_DAUCS|nr:hypothetical protein DCAR_0414546 [Daucus carota subsp. sativus]
MEQRGAKRKHIEIVRKDLSVALTKLVQDSAKLNNDMRAAKEDFELMSKSMLNRKAEFLTQGLFLEEQHRRVIDILDGKNHGDEPEPIEHSTLLPPSSTTDMKKFSRESGEALRDHRIIREVEIQSLEGIFTQLDLMMKQNMKELRERAEGIERERRELSGKLLKLSRSTGDASGSA